MRLIYALFAGYMADLMIGWVAVWLAPHTGDLTYRFYMAPGEWFVDPMKAPFGQTGTANPLIRSAASPVPTLPNMKFESRTVRSCSGLGYVTLI